MAEVLSQACCGSGEIWVSSLSVNHCGFTGPFSVSTTCDGEGAATFVTSSGKKPGAYSPQLTLFARSRLIQKTTSRLVTGVPSDHL